MFDQLLLSAPPLNIILGLEHLLGLINDVLEMSKIEVGRIRLNETSFDLHHLLDTLEEMWNPKPLLKVSC